MRNDKEGYTDGALVMIRVEEEGWHLVTMTPKIEVAIIELIKQMSPGDRMHLGKMNEDVQEPLTHLMDAMHEEAMEVFGLEELAIAAATGVIH